MKNFNPSLIRTILFKALLDSLKSLLETCFGINYRIMTTHFDYYHFTADIYMTLALLVL